ncbi:hypothetical protein BCAR13_1280029 [Paraburkholderia caribensis]|nr:hypothetical protein BCAR13_1280029 [Paraburkholderia caribensis]
MALAASEQRATSGARTPQCNLRLVSGKTLGAIPRDRRLCYKLRSVADDVLARRFLARLARFSGTV